MNTNTNSVTNPVPTNIISDAFSTAQQVMENHEQRIGKVEQTVTRELDLISKDDIANRVAKQIDVEDIAEHIDREEVAQAMDIDMSNLVEYIDMDEIAEAVSCDISTSSIADHIDARDIAEHIDMDEIVSEAADRIDLYSLAREFDTSDIANECCTSDIAEYIDVDEVASYVDLDEVATNIVDNMKEGLGGTMVDAFVKAVTERDILREQVLTLKADLRTEQQEQVKEIATFKARIEELEGEAENNRPVVDGAGPNDAAPTPELSNG